MSRLTAPLRSFQWRICVAACALSVATNAVADEDTKDVQAVMSALPHDYSAARLELTRHGWQAYPTHRLADGSVAPCWNEYSSGVTCTFIEVEDCSGTGQGFCVMWFRNGAGDLLKLTTVGGAPPDSVLIHSWSVEVDAPEITEHDLDAFEHFKKNVD